MWLVCWQFRFGEDGEYCQLGYTEPIQESSKSFSSKKEKKFEDSKNGDEDGKISE